ncbi:MAG: DUF234 domain-containing protein, partial [Chloroflexi bacterium]|nr:DUF234 domain-containing protein [Chloroflexota bacterium]
FVVREVPVTEDEATSRRGHYFVTDPYLRFYYHFLAAFQSKLALGAQDELLELIRQAMPEFIRMYTWKDLCREWILRASVAGDIPISVEKVGGFWFRKHEIDLVGIDHINGCLLLADCRWNESLLHPDVLSELIDKTSVIVPDDGREWVVHYIGFATRGWEAGIQDVATQMAARNTKKGKWRSAGIRLVDLKTVDDDLFRWSQKT